MSKVNFEKNLRKLKLLIVNGEIELKPVPNRVKELSVVMEKIRDTFGDFILTGSTTLYLYGFIDRPPNDYDIYIKESDSYKYIITHTPSYGFDFIDENRLGYVGISYEVKRDESFIDNFINRYKTVRIMSDVFLREDSKMGNYFEKVENIKVDHPTNILKEKIKMGGFKNIKDLSHVFDNILNP